MMSFINTTTSAMAGPGNTTVYATPALSEIEAGLGLGLSSCEPTQTTVAAGSDERSQGSYPGHIQSPEKPLLGLGLGLPTEELHSSFRVQQPMIGLGIYISGWEVVDDREEEDKEEEQEQEAPPPSPPLLPTRRVSPFRIDVIIDDDECPPTHPIFTPPMPESEVMEVEYPFRPIIRRPTFMSAPSASELPIPFAQRPSGVGLGISLSTGLPTAPTASPQSGEVEPAVDDSIASGSPHTPFVFQPFTPLPEDEYGIFPHTITGEDDFMAEPVALTAPSFMPHVPNVFSPHPVTPAGTEAYFHLPSSLFVSPLPVAFGCTEVGTIYETPSFTSRWF